MAQISEPFTEIDASEVKDDNEEVYVSYAQASLKQKAPKSVASPATPKTLSNDKSCSESEGRDACNGVGICFNSVCYCDTYHSGDKCEVDLAHPGVKTWLAIVFYLTALFFGLLTGYFISVIYNRNKKRLFK